MIKESTSSASEAWDGHRLFLYDSEPDRVAAVAAWVQRSLHQGAKNVYTEAVEDGLAWVDLEHLRFLDAAGARAIADSNETFPSGGVRMLLVAPAPAVARVLHLRGADEVPGLTVAGGTT